MDAKDAEYFFSTHPGKVIRSKRFLAKPENRDMRIVSQVFEYDNEVSFTADLREVIIRETPSGRQRIKASVFEDDRSVQTLTIQRYKRFANTLIPYKEEHFSFRGEEIRRLKKFLASIETMSFDEETKGQLTDEELNNVILGQVQAQKLVENNHELFRQLMEEQDWEQDVIALGYRRNQLNLFERLLHDSEYFEAQCSEQAKGPEDIWQDYFERNTWIFGYGLSYQFLSALDHQKLEQTVQGYAQSTPGKRTDGLVKTMGALSALCFVEIKHHKTNLVSNSYYRSGSWTPSRDLSGGVSQLQATVRAAMDQFGRQLRPTDKNGNPTGEHLHLVSPTSFLVIGDLSEFQTPDGPNVQQFGCFEDFRRNLNRPTILTFDELYERAKFIVSNS